MELWQHDATGLARLAFRRASQTLIAAALLTASANGRAQDMSTVSYAVEEGFGGGATLTITARLYRPSGESAVPAVIVLHGCSGLVGSIFDRAKRIAAWGYVVVVPDSFGSRSKTNVCNEPIVMPPGMRVLDVIATAEYLATLPFVRRDRIALIGFSHGAGTVIDALQSSLSSVGIRGGVAYYPLCIPEKQTNVSMPLLVLIGEKDDWAPPARCRALQEGLRAPSPANIILYPGAYDGFDVNEPPQSVSGADLSSQDGSVGDTVQHHIEYDPGAARDAEARTRAFLERLLK